MQKLGFLFGAGAEICYGLPTGGKFALDIFRQDVSISKKEFIEMRDSIDGSTTYAGEWLPDDYKTRSVSSYGKSVIENIIKDTLEYKREHIISKLNDFDSYAKNGKKHIGNIDDIISDLLNRQVSNCQLNTVISFNNALTVILPFSSVSYSPITWLFASRTTLNFAPLIGWLASSTL